MTDENNRGKVFRDPIHGLISIDRGEEVILELIDTPEFQRLRRIRQLGVSSFTYPGAEHTRFAHCLGVFQFAKRIIARLLDRHGASSPAGQALSKHALQLKIAALLHDVGHGPFSHASEHVFDKKKAHEHRSQGLIRDSGTGIHEVLKNHLSTSEIEQTADLLDGHEYPFIKDIISSQLDADRMDYLIRDSLYTGTQYGSYDADWMIHSFCLGLQGGEDACQRPTNYRLCLDTSRGVYAAEQILEARRHMHLQVYFHGKTRNLEGHLKCLFHEAARLVAEDDLPPHTHPEVVEFFKTRGEVSHHTFVTLDDSCLWAQFSYWAGCRESHPELAAWSESLISRKPLLQTFDIPEDAVTSITEARIRAMFEKGQPNSQENRDWVIDPCSFRPYKAFVDSDTAGSASAKVLADSAILLSDGSLQGPSIPLHEQSHTVSGLGQETTHVFRIFCKPELASWVQNLVDELTTYEKKKSP